MNIGKSFENPTDPESQGAEREQSYEYVDQRWVEEMRKPKSEWSDEFKEFVEEQYKREYGEVEDEQELTHKQEVVQRYFRMLRLTEDDLRNKKITDLGCGENAEFLSYCIENGISQEILGIDWDLSDEALEKYPDNLVESDFRGEIPGEDLDLILANGSVYPFGDSENIKVVVKDALEKLKQGGEMRVFPVEEIAPESSHSDIAERLWNEALSELEDEEGVSITTHPIFIHVDPNKEPVLKKLLVARKN